MSDVSLTVRNVTLRGEQHVPGLFSDGSAIRIEGPFVVAPVPTGGFYMCGGCTLLVEDSVVTGNGSGAATGLVGYATATIRRASVVSNTGPGISLVVADRVIEDTTVGGNARIGAVGQDLPCSPQCSSTVDHSTIVGGGGDAGSGSVAPAIGHGNDAACLATDQRGVARPAPAGGHCDVGSYEYDTGCGASLEAAGAAPVALLLARRRRRRTATR